MRHALKKCIFCFLTVLVILSCASTGETIQDKPWWDLGKVSYGDDPKQYVEITLPESNADNVNVILYVHGYSNSMTDLTLLDNYRENFIIGNLEYRYLTVNTTNLSLNELLSDIHNGLGEIRKKASENGITINKCVIMGTSLGGMLSLMYSYTFLDNTAIPIAFCVSLAGQADWTDATIMHFANRPGHWLNKNFIAGIGSIFTNTTISMDDLTDLGITGNAFEQMKKMSAIYLVNENVPPTIIVHDTGDDTAPFSSSAALNHVLGVYKIPHIFIQSVTNSGHNLGTSSSPIPGRVTRVLHPLIETKLIESMDHYIDLFCD